MSPFFEQLEHTADLALRIYGRDLRELFAHAAQAMFSQVADMTCTSKPGDATVQRQVAVQGLDYESLLVNWLNELLYLHETQREVYTVFNIVQLSLRRLKAVVRGGPSQAVHTMIKAATYHQLAIERTAEGYAVTVVFDV